MENTEKNDVKKVEIPKYLQAEHLLEAGVTASIFDLKLEDLVFEKMVLMFEKYNPAVKKLDTAKIDLQMQKDKLLLETDFKTELNESRPTVAMKEAYIKPLVAKFEDKVDECKDQVEYYKSKLAIVNDLIKNRRIELKIENTLLEEE